MNVLPYENFIGEQIQYILRVQAQMPSFLVPRISCILEFISIINESNTSSFPMKMNMFSRGCPP